MKKPKVINLSKNNKKSEQVESVLIRPEMKEKAMSYLERRRSNEYNDNIGSNKSNYGFFRRINDKLNSMSRFQYFLLIVIVLLFGIASFQVSVGKISNPVQTVTELIPESFTNKVNCEEDILNPFCWPNKVVPSLKKTDGTTNALLIGLDTRGSNSGLMNTDTLMVASYDHSTGKTLLISFPRDLYVNYSVNGSKTGYSAKIKSIYAMGEARNDTDGLTMLTENIETWLDLEIHYTAKVYFNTVTDVVDAIGGITIELDEKYQDVYPYDELSSEYQQNCIRASDLPKYCVFNFNEGVNELNGEDALIYARMRQYSSDFDRARRQQEVVNAIKTKVLNDDTNILEKASFGWDIYQKLKETKNIDAEVSNNDLIAAALLLTKSDPDPIRVVLDPNLGGGGFFSEGRVGQGPEGEGGMYALRPIDPTFGKIREEIDKIRQYPDLYRDNASVVVANYTGKDFDLNSNFKKLEKEDPYFDFLVFTTGKVRESQNEIKIYIFNREKTFSAKYLVDYFGLKTEDVEIVTEETEEKQTTYKEDIKIVVSNPQTEVNTDEASETDQ